MPDFLSVYFAAVCSVRDGEVAEIDVSHQVQTDESTTTLTVTIRRDQLTYPAAVDEG